MSSNPPKDPRKSARLEALLVDALRPGLLGPGEVQVLVSRVMSALPPASAMTPFLRPAIRIAFGLTAVAFAFASRMTDLRSWLEVPGVPGHLSLGLIAAGAALGAGSVAVSLIAQTSGQLRSVFSGRAAQVLLGSAFSAVVLALMWQFVGSIPAHLAPQGLHAARATLLVLMALLVAGTMAQAAAIARGAGTEAALRMVEGLGLGISAVACVASYALFVV